MARTPSPSGSGTSRTGSRDEASRLLWERYFTRLARLAQVRLRNVARGPADGVDVALSVFDSFFQGVAAGQYPGLGNRDDLWRLLVTITARKACNQRRDEGRQKRGSGRVVGEVRPGRRRPSRRRLPGPGRPQRQVDPRIRCHGD